MALQTRFSCGAGLASLMAGSSTEPTVPLGTVPDCPPSPAAPGTLLAPVHPRCSLPLARAASPRALAHCWHRGRCWSARWGSSRAALSSLRAPGYLSLVVRPSCTSRAKRPFRRHSALVRRSWPEPEQLRAPGLAFFTSFRAVQLLEPSTSKRDAKARKAKRRNETRARCLGRGVVRGR